MVYLQAGGIAIENRNDKRLEGAKTTGGAGAGQTRVLKFYDKVRHRFYCASCDHGLELASWLIFNPERFVVWHDNFSQDHGECHLYPTVQMARAERRWARVMREGSI